MLHEAVVIEDFVGGLVDSGDRGVGGCDGGSDGDVDNEIEVVLAVPCNAFTQFDFFLGGLFTKGTDRQGRGREISQWLKSRNSV